MDGVARPLALWLGLMAAGLALPFVAGDYLVGVAFTIWMWIALTQSWVMLSGLTGYISLGHSVFFGIGAYTLVLGWPEMPIILAVPLAGLAAGLFALLIGYPVLRVRGPYFVILSYGLAELVKFIVVNVEAGLGKSGRLLFDAPPLFDLYLAMLGLALVATAMVHVLRRSRFGTGLRALRDDEEAAETIGVPVARYKLYAFALSAVIPGMIGAVMVMRMTYFEPLDLFSPVVSFTIVIMAIIGGSDDAPGPVLGVVFLIVLREMLWTTFPEIYMIIVGAMLVGFVLYAPDGVYGRVLTLQRKGTR